MRSLHRLGRGCSGPRDRGDRGLQRELAFYGRLQEEGTIENFEPVFLEPHGGDLNGFILIRGDAEKLAALRVSEEFTQIATKATLVVETSASSERISPNGSKARWSSTPRRSERSRSPAQDQDPLPARYQVQAP